MPLVTDATNKQVPLPLWPVGFRCPQDKQATFEEIEKWKEKKPNLVLQQSYLTVGGVIVTVVGAVLGIIGFKKDSKLGKWFGGILGLVGIASGGFGVYLERLISQALKAERESNDAAQKFSEMSIVISLQKILGEKNASRQSEMRKELISSPMEDLSGLKETLEKIKSGNSDEKIRKEAECCLKILHEEEERVPNAIICIKDKSKDKHTRCEAMRQLGKVINDEHVIDVLIECLNDKANHWEVRVRAVDFLRNTKGQKAINAFLNCIKDKSDDPRLRSEVLMALPEDTHVDLLFNILTDPNDDIPYVRDMAAILLHNLAEKGNKEVITRCKSLTNSNDQLVKSFTESVDRITKRMEEEKKDPGKS